MASASSGRLAQTTVSMPLDAGMVAKAVPLEPAPTTATFSSSDTAGGSLLPALRVPRTEIHHELRQLVHDLVGDRAEGLFVARAVPVVGEVDRRPGLHPDGTAELEAARAVALPHVLRPPHRHGQHGDTGGEGQPGDPGPPAPRR